RRRAARIALASAAAVALAALAFAASSQVAVWRDSFTLYERAIAVSPQASFPYLRLGMVYAMRGSFGEALPRFRRSVELDPSSAKEILHQLDSMASDHAGQGRPAEAGGTASVAIAVAEETRETGTGARGR